MYEFERLSADFGVRMKDENTIIEKWPIHVRPTYSLEKTTAEHEFRLVLASGFLGLDIVNEEGNESWE